MTQPISLTPPDQRALLDDTYRPPGLDERTWRPGDPPALPPIPESAYPPGARPLPVADVIANPGQTIRLIDGADVQLRYSMASLRRLEARFGSIAGIQVELNTAQAQLKAAAAEGATDAGRGPIFTILSDALAAGLLHVRVQHPDTGAMVRLGTDSDLVMEQLDPAQLQPYLDAFAAALGGAFGTAGKAASQAMREAGQSLSPGESGTTSPPLSPDAQTDSSGG